MDRRSLLLGIAATLAACQPPEPGQSAAASGGGLSEASGGGGVVGAGGGGGAPSTASGGADGPIDPAAACRESGDVLRVGLTKLRRMARDELDHTLRDLLAISNNPSSSISPDESVGPFYSNAITPITDLLVQQHDELASRVANQVVSRKDEIAGCDLAGPDAANCVSSFVESFGLRAYRRPLDPSERDEYVKLYEGELARSDSDGAFRLVLSTFLASPFFLYHHDIGANATAPAATPAPLTSYEIASRLSYFLWRTMPDTRLFELAANDTLRDESVLGAEVDRMIADPKAADAIPEFHVAWLGVRDLVGIEKEKTVYPGFDEGLAADMQKEVAAFTDHVVREGDGLMSTLFTAKYSFIDGGLFGLYGVERPADFRPGAQVALNPSQRGGVLTQAAFLAAHAHRDSSSPVHRGIAVRENLLCQPLDPPPPGVNLSLPKPTAGKTIRDSLAGHQSNEVCASCHVLIDPIGLAFENYDGIGAYRTSWASDGSSPVDATGEIFESGPDVNGKFNGAVELGERLAASQTAADCLASQWFRFALGRMESEDDACSLVAIQKAFAESGNNVRTLLASVAKSDAFLHVRSTASAP